jgi:hypothetical protein
MNKKVFVLLLLIFLILNLNFIIHLDEFVFLKNSEYSDIPISHFPNIYFIQQEIRLNHEIPLWSNLIYSGYPFIEDPLSGIWYLWGWIAILFPLPLGININLLLHMFLGIVGLFLLLRLENRSIFASIFGAFAFGFSTKLISHIGAGHLSMIYAVCWTPWLFYFTKRIQFSKTWTGYIFPGIVFGFIISADPRWIVPSGLLWFFYVLLLQIEIKRKMNLLLGSVSTGLLTSIGIWFSLLNFLKYSTRTFMTMEDRNVYSLKTSHLLGFLFPDNGSFSEWILYPSAIVLLLVVLGIFLYKENKPIRFWYIVVLVSLLLSFGNSIPVLGFVYSLPGFSLLRVPSRFIWLVFFAFSFISSFTMDYLLVNKKSYKFDRFFFLVPISVFQILLLIGIFSLSGSINFLFIFSTVFFIFGTIIIGLILHKNYSPTIKQVGLVSLLLFELFVININSIKYKKSDVLLNTKPELLSELKSMPQYTRIYTPSYSISQEEAAYWRINQINGVDPMQLSEYVKFFEKASGIDYSDYSVTLPPFRTGNPEFDNQAACPDKIRLGELNVGMVVSDFEFENCPGFSNYEKFNDKFVYQVDSIQKPVYFENNESEVELMVYSPNRIQVKTDHGGRLYFREIFYPGWKALVNGSLTEVGKSEIFRFIDLPDGENIVELRFIPDFLKSITGIQVLSLSFVLALLFLEQINVSKNK